MQRATESIPNVNGTIRYEFAFDVDHEGGRSISTLIERNLMPLEDFLVSQMFELVIISLYRLALL